MKPVPDAGYMPQLDSLRAFAVTSVAISHWTPEFLEGIVPWGTGVQLFFVLSGFLITGILLRSRPADLGISMPAALKVFYIRRGLRIFPVYYAVLAFSLLVGVGPIYTTWPWHVPYLSNVYYAWHGHDTPLADPFLHLWSLSVEEQFYFLWPFIALVASRRVLFIMLCTAIVASMVFRVAIDHMVPGVLSVRYMTASCVDAFAVGALIAYAKHYKGWIGVGRCKWMFAGIGTLGLIISVLWLPHYTDHEIARRMGHTFLVIFYGAILAQTAAGFGGLLGAVLTFKPILYLGRISYGIYVYHYFAPAGVHWLAARFGVNMGHQEPATLVAYTIFTLALAISSWHLLEFPINRLKRHFAYPNARAVRTSPGASIARPVASI
jgi:peptidoglycan/LPS O-acetylase OafA/YrhL